MDTADLMSDEPDRVNHTKKEVMERGEWLNYALKGWTGRERTSSCFESFGR